MKDNIQRFWKEYLVAVAIIVITGIFINTDMVKFLQTMTGFAVSKSTATIVVNYSYIFLIILGPLLLIGTAGYSYYLNRLNGINNTNNNNFNNNNNHFNFNNHLHHNNNTSLYHNAQDFHKVKFSSIDHEFHHFPHDNMMNLNSSSNNLNSALNNLNSNSNNETSNEAQFMTNNLNNLNNSNNLNNPIPHSMRNPNLDTSHYLCYPNAMDHLVLKQHIKNKLMQGHIMTEISEKLLEHNWPLEKINTAFNDLKFTNVESEIMLGSFVTSSLIAGYDVNTIRQTLVQKGWESKTVDKMINLVFK